MPNLTEVTFPAGEVIMKEGDAPDYMYVIKSGRVKVTKGENDLFLAEMTRDGVFGDIALIDRQPRSATVTAVEETECFKISIDDFDEMLQGSHPLLQTIFKIIAARMRHMNDQLAKATN